MANRLNRHCAYFKCHKRLEDCTFCYCPFYPCDDNRLGRYVIMEDKRTIWSCKDCDWIHNKKVVDKIFNTIRSDNLRIRQAIGNLKSKKAGIVILGHGSKLNSANDAVRSVAAEIKKKSGLGIVEPAYLQFCEPSLQRAVKKVVRAGCKKVIIVPFFLFTGNHVKRDIPEAIKREAKVYREVKFIYAKNIGQDPRISDILMDRIKESIV